MATIEKRTSKDGKTSFRAKVRVKGYKTETATFSNITLAKNWANAIESDMKRGKYKSEAQAKRHTLKELIDKYIEEKLPERKKEYQAEFEMQLNWWKSKIGAYLLSEITPSLLSKYKNILSKEVDSRTKPDKKKKKSENEESKKPKLKSKATVNRYMSCLSIVLTKAVKEWEWIESNPMLRVDKFKEPKGRKRFLSQEEQTNLLNACKNSGNNLIYLLVVLTLSTGARYGELLNLKWENVKINDKTRTVTIYLMNTKNGDSRTVFAYGLGYELLKQHSKIRKINSKYIFARPDGLKPYDLRKQWEKALKNANIEDFRFHDLRHTTASNLAMNGASLRDIAEILGHRTLQMVQRYSHLTEQYTEKVLKELNEKQFQTVENAK